jgi:hypothetical protein
MLWCAQVADLEQERHAAAIDREGLHDKLAAQCEAEREAQRSIADLRAALEARAVPAHPREKP